MQQGPHSPSLSRGLFAVSPKGVEVAPLNQREHKTCTHRTRCLGCVSVWSTITLSRLSPKNKVKDSQYYL